MAEIKAIETEYNGYKFRSRLEARWAIFFDALGVEYEYEPEGFKLPNGDYYLPDFRLQCYGTRGCSNWKPFDLYIEVKGKMTSEDMDKIHSFSVKKIFYDECETQIEEIQSLNPVLIVGKIPDVNCEQDTYDSNIFDNYNGMNDLPIYPFNYGTIDGDYFACYPAATKDGKFYLFGDDSNYINECDCPRLVRAYKIAKQARFEHGETPAKQEIQRKMREYKFR